MIRLLLVIATASFCLTSCLSTENQATILKTDEKTLLGTPKEAPLQSTDTASGTKTAPTLVIPAWNDTDTSTNGDVSPESDVVTPIGAPESAWKSGIGSE